LCIPVCPVDCIELENVTGALTGWAAWSADAAKHALKRYTIHSDLVNKNAGYKTISNIKKAEEKLTNLPEHSQHTDPVVLDKKRAVIEAALAKARAKRS
jgi:electron transport complex protein RnfB